MSKPWSIYDGRTWLAPPNNSLCLSRQLFFQRVFLYHYLLFLLNIRKASTGLNGVAFFKTDTDRQLDCERGSESGPTAEMVRIFVFKL